VRKKQNATQALSF